METVNEIKSGFRIQVLFVDDEENVLRSLRRLFVDEAYEIIVANSGEEALRVIQSNPDIGLIVSDQRMPGLTGVDFLAKAREIAPDALRILLTGYADINAVAEAINRGGAYRYITKPWKDQELIQIIGEAAQQYSLRKENKRLQEIIKRKNDELRKWNTQLESYVQEQTLEIQEKNKKLEHLNKNLKDNFRNSILAFSGLVELRDKRTANHSNNVAEIATKVARSMGLPIHDLETITIAALLHDIGKIGIPDALLIQEVEHMDTQGEKEYQKHSVRGQAAIDSVENLRSAGVLIRHHHEWFNGSGFPDKLYGRKIPLGSRIITAADFFENTARKLDLENKVDATLEILKNKNGIMFDPEIYPHIRSVVKDIYAKLEVTTGMGEKELDVNNIKEGMVISKDVKSGTGIILLSKGTKLNDRNIQALKRYYQLDPSKCGIFVLVER